MDWRTGAEGPDAGEVIHNAARRLYNIIICTCQCLEYSGIQGQGGGVRHFVIKYLFGRETAFKMCGIHRQPCSASFISTVISARVCTGN